MRPYAKILLPRLVAQLRAGMRPRQHHLTSAWVGRPSHAIQLLLGVRTMANMEHVQLVRRGRDAVARWREENPNQMLDLNAAYLSYARMPQVNLAGADLRDSDLMGAMLPRANLAGCYLNPSHLYHANLTQANLRGALLNGANLRGANLTGADLSNADLDRAVLSEANLTGANLAGAKLSRATLTGANLTDADLTGADLSRAAVTQTILVNADCKGADFYAAVFHNPDLAGARLGGSMMGYTVFQDCDVSAAQGLDQVRHDAPSTIGIDTLYRSGGDIAEEFLVGAGVPLALIEFQRSLPGVPGSKESCFISCASADITFAQALQRDLREQGVRCWLFPDNARGNALVDRLSTSDQEEVERWVRAYDKLVVVCSRAALDSETVRNDIIGVKERQLSEDRWLLFLAAADDAVVQPRGRGLARDLSSEHVVFDLRDRDSNAEFYGAEVGRLAEMLKMSQPAGAGALELPEL